MDTQENTVTQSELEPQTLPPSGVDGSSDDDEEQYYIRLDTRKLPEELTRIRQEKPDVANTIFTVAGQRTAERYQNEIKLRDLELEEARRERRLANYTRMTDAEINKRYTEDSAFARQYTEDTHADPAEMEARRAFIAFESEVRNLTHKAANRGLPEHKIEEFMTALGAGKYDKDERGQPYQSYGQVLARMNDDLTDELLNTHRNQANSEERESSGSRAEVAPPSSGNPTLTSGGPSASASNTRGSVGKKPVFRTWKEAAAAFSEDRITAEEYERAKVNLPYE